jgi:hypothetical protein
LPLENLWSNVESDQIVRRKETSRHQKIFFRRAMFEGQGAAERRAQDEELADSSVPPGGSQKSYCPAAW